MCASKGEINYGAVKFVIICCQQYRYIERMLNGRQMLQPSLIYTLGNIIYRIYAIYLTSLDMVLSDRFLVIGTNSFTE